MNRWLKRAWEGWKKVASVIGRFQTRVLLTLFYFLILGPAWALMRLFGGDPLKRRRREDSSYWEEHQVTGDEIERARRQF